MERAEPEAIRDAYLRALEKINPNARQEFNRGQSIFGKTADLIASMKGRGAKALFERWASCWQDFLSRYPVSSYSPAAHYLLGLIDIRLQRKASAADHFREIVRNPGKLNTFHQKAIYLEAATRDSSAEALEKAGLLLTDPDARNWAFADWQKRKR